MKPTTKATKWRALLIGSVGCMIFFLCVGGVYLFSLWQGHGNHAANLEMLNIENEHFLGIPHRLCSPRICDGRRCHNEPYF